MTTPVIIDIIAGAVLVGFAASGARRGLLRSLAGLAVVAVALVGAGILARALTPPAAQLVTPLIEERLHQRVDEALAARPGEMPEAEVDDPGEDQLSGLLALLGLDEDVRTGLEGQVQDKLQDAGETILSALVASLAQSVLYTVLFALSFAGLTLALRLAVRALDLVARLPGLHLANSLGGAAIGLLEGALLVFLAIWVLRRLGVSFDTETVRASHIVSFFASHTPLSALRFLL